jgi:hypothetical protein
VLPDADHNDDELLAGEEMIRAIIGFVQPLGLTPDSSNRP